MMRHEILGVLPFPGRFIKMAQLLFNSRMDRQRVRVHRQSNLGWGTLPIHKAMLQK